VEVHVVEDFDVGAGVGERHALEGDAALELLRRRFPAG